jgi:hypothetical protein
MAFLESRAMNTTWRHRISRNMYPRLDSLGSKVGGHGNDGPFNDGVVMRAYEEESGAISSTQ